MGQSFLYGGILGGEDMEATLLWENPKPNDSFNKTTLTLPNYSEYDYMLIEYKASTTINIIAQALFDIDTLLNNTTGMENPKFMLGARSGFPQVTAYGSVKREIYTSNHLGTNLEIEYAYISTSTNNESNYCIPLKIYGVKGTIKGLE